MTDEIKKPSNRVDSTHDGKFHAFWHGRMVYENGRVKRFETESEAWAFLARCDSAGKIIH
jgi:pyoverdine/dityrosine biosynthesis protein Dit1